MKKHLAELWRKHIAWRFVYCRHWFVYRRYLKNYRAVFALRDKEVPVKMEFRCGLVLEYSNAAGSLHIFDEIFVLRSYRLPHAPQIETIIDAGANVGLFSVYALLKYPQATIYAIEADPLVFQELSRNVEANGLGERIRVFHLALTSSAGKAVLYSGKYGWSSIFKSGGCKDGAPSEVEGMSLSGFCKKTGIKRIDLLKADIEGAEYDMILGDPGFYENKAERMIVEVDRSPRDKRYHFDTLIETARKHYRSVRLEIVDRNADWPILYCSSPLPQSPHGSIPLSNGTA